MHQVAPLLCVGDGEIANDDMVLRDRKVCGDGAHRPCHDAQHDEKDGAREERGEGMRRQRAAEHTKRLRQAVRQQAMRQQAMRQQAVRHKQ